MNESRLIWRTVRLWRTSALCGLLPRQMSRRPARRQRRATRSALRARALAGRRRGVAASAARPLSRAKPVRTRSLTLSRGVLLYLHSSGELTHSCMRDLVPPGDTVPSGIRGPAKDDGDAPGSLIFNGQPWSRVLLTFSHYSRQGHFDASADRTDFVVLPLEPGTVAPILGMSWRRCCVSSRDLTDGRN
jgi:hypothetical protein